MSAVEICWRTPIIFHAWNGRSEAMVVWMADEPLLPGKQYLVKQTTNMVTGQVSTIRYRLDVNTLQREPVPAPGDERSPDAAR